MQTSIAKKYRSNAQVTVAEQILRKCVHCGFCLATCPTYNILGDELDSPRGRIYLIKQVLEGHEPTAKTQLHLDRCLTCRNCETTCPSGVEYGHLVDIGRNVVNAAVPRSPAARLFRWIIRNVLPYPQRIGPLVRLGQSVRQFMPVSVRQSIPARRDAGALPTQTRARQMLMLGGCVQPSMSPTTNAATMRVLDRLGIEVMATPAAGCCGAINYHLDDIPTGKELMRRNIDAWWPLIDAGAEAIVINASGCGAMVKEYGHVLSDDPVYREKAQQISALSKDLAEIIAAEDIESLRIDTTGSAKIAFHPPCTLQHGQKLAGITEQVLVRLGFVLTPVPDSHTCCGSAGTYSLLQKKLSAELKVNKINNLESGQPALIATANIGCQLHIQSGTSLPVKHWIELLDVSDKLGT